VNAKFFVEASSDFEKMIKHTDWRTLLFPGFSISAEWQGKTWQPRRVAVDGCPLSYSTFPPMKTCLSAGVQLMSAAAVEADFL